MMDRIRRYLVTTAALTAALRYSAAPDRLASFVAHGFVLTPAQALTNRVRHPLRRECLSVRAAAPSEEVSVDDDDVSTTTEASSQPPGVELPWGDSYSTLTLLEHVHLLVPESHARGAVSFFANEMGFGLDPRSVENVVRGSGVAFVNAGPSQIHLNDDVAYCQSEEERLAGDGEGTGKATRPIFEVGLKYDDVQSLKERLEGSDRTSSYEVEEGRDGREAVRVTDSYGNVFVAREGAEGGSTPTEDDEPTIATLCQQKVLQQECESDVASHGNEVVAEYGIPGDGDTEAIGRTSCRGIDYIEFFVPVGADDGGGKTTEKIARFYEFFFDAPVTAVVDGDGSGVAVIGFGKIDANGRSEQSLLFREVSVNADDKEVEEMRKSLGGHHIAIYVGSNGADFEVATNNCLEGGLLWVNPKFEDRVLDVESAVALGQFRLKDIIDIETGDVLFTLEHEVKSVNNEFSPMK